MTSIKAILERQALGRIRTIVVLKIDNLQQLADISQTDAEHMLSQSSASMAMLSALKHDAGNKGSNIGLSWQVWAKVGTRFMFLRLLKAYKLLAKLHETLPHNSQPSHASVASLPPATTSIPPPATAPQTDATTATAPIPPPTSPPTSPATQPPQRTPAAQLLLWRAPIAETPLTRDATTTVADIQSAGMVLVHHPHQQLVQEAHPLQEQQQKQAMIQGGKKRRAYGDADQHKVLKVLHTGVQQWPPHSHSTGVANNMQSSCSQMLRVYRFGALDGAIAAGTMLGKGGEGNVMSLRLPDTGQQVACKIPQSRLADGYLQDEQGYAGMIQHEHVSRLLGYGHVKPAMDV